MIPSLRVPWGNERKGESQLEKAYASLLLLVGWQDVNYSILPHPPRHDAETCENDSKQILHLVNCFSQVFGPNDEKG